MKLTEPDQTEIQPIADQVEKWKRTIHRILNNKNKSSRRTTTSEFGRTDKGTTLHEAAEKDDEKAMTVKAEAEEAVKFKGRRHFKLKRSGQFERCH